MICYPSVACLFLHVMECFHNNDDSCSKFVKFGTRVMVLKFGLSQVLTAWRNLWLFACKETGVIMLTTTSTSF
jgi:hypothetical protein